MITESVISEFFAVTKTSVYHVANHEKYGGSAKKIALKDENESNIPIGATLEDGPGRLIAIRSRLLAFIPESHGWLSQMTGFERNPERVNTRWHEGNSSQIIALFETKDEALDCFSANNLQPADLRWTTSTNKVLEKIGDNHPTFVISRWHGDCLLPELATS